MLSPEATYDLVSIHGRLDRTPNGVSQGETHLLCYLACLLALYRGHPVSDWGYKFVRTGWGTPFSEHVATAYAGLSQAGHLVEVGTAYRLTDNGFDFQNALSTQTQFAWREQFLETAASTALALPVGLIREALQTEPNLRAAAALNRTTALLQEYTLHELHEQFSALSEAVGLGVSDLLVPSTVWVSYLLEVERRRHLENTSSSPQS